MTHFIGIDPGVSGGIAVIDETGKPLSIRKMPETRQDIWDYFQAWRDARAMIERLSGMPGDVYVDAISGKKFRVARQTPATMSVLYRNAGQLEMAATAAEIPLDSVLPRQWQTALGVAGNGKETTTVRKNRHKAKAQSLFPGVKVTLATCDALLLAEFCRRREIGNLAVARATVPARLG